MPSTINASSTSTSGLIQTADATGILQLQSNGVTGLTVGSTANVTVNTNLFVSGYEVEPLVAETAKATTSGTSIDFTGIPNWVKRITVMFRGISTNGTSGYIVRLGTSGGFVATGYLSSGSAYGGSAGGSAVAYTTGFGLAGTVVAASTFTGILTIVNISGTFWVSSFSGAFTDAPYTATAGGSVDAGGTVTQIRLTTVNGTDTFDAGSINILYE